MPKNITQDQQAAAQNIQNEIQKKQILFADLKESLFPNADFGVFSDVAYCFMDVSETEESQKNNIQLLELLATKSGQVDFAGKQMAGIFNLSFRNLPADDPDKLLEFYQNNFIAVQLASDTKFCDQNNAFYSGMMRTMLQNNVAFLKECKFVKNVAEYVADANHQDLEQMQDFVSHGNAFAPAQFGNANSLNDMTFNAAKEQIKQQTQAQEQFKNKRYKQLLAEKLNSTLDSIPASLSNSPQFKAAIKPLKNISASTNDKNDLANVQKSYRLFESYQAELEAKMLDDSSPELEASYSAVINIMTMLDNIELEAQQVLSGKDITSLEKEPVFLGNKQYQEALQDLMSAACQHIKTHFENIAKNPDRRLDKELLKQEFASIIVCNQYLKNIQNNEPIELDRYSIEVNNLIYDDDLMDYLVKDETLLNDARSFASEEFKNRFAERVTVIAESLERSRSAYKVTPKIVMDEEIPYFIGFRDNLRVIRNQLAVLGYAEGTAVLDLPKMVRGSKKTNYGKYQRNVPVTYSQQMALLTEMLDTVIDNIELDAYLAIKNEKVVRIKDADTRYKDTLDFLDEEIQKAMVLEKETRNRYLSAYEMNVAYLETLPEVDRNKPENINKYYPVDAFKAAWEEASRKLSKLQNQKVDTENAYKEESDSLMRDYKDFVIRNKENEIALRENPDGPKHAKNAWNSLRNTIQQIKNEAAQRTFTEDDLDKEPVQGQMSNFDKWKIQSDVETLGNLIESLSGIKKYNNQFESIEKVNKKFDEFEMKVADFFDDEYQDVDVEDVTENNEIKQGLDSQIQALNDKISIEDNERKSKNQPAVKSQPSNGDYNADPQKMGHIGRDDYGVLIRTTLEKQTENYKELQEAREFVKNDIKDQEKSISQYEKQIKVYKTDIEGFEKDIAEKNKEVDEWKYPEDIPYTHTEKEFDDLETSLKDIQQKINAKEKSIEDRKILIKSLENHRDVELPKIADIELKNLEITGKNYQQLSKELAEFNDKYRKFEEDYNKEVDDDEFKNVNLDEWKAEYIKLSPDDDVDEIFELFNRSLEEAKKIGIELSNQEYSYRKAKDKFNALESFRKASKDENIKSEKQYKEDELKLRREIADQYRQKRKELFAKIQKERNELFDKYDSYDRPELDETTLFDDIPDPEFSPDNPLISGQWEELSEEYPALQESFNRYFPDWKELVQQQVRDLLERQNEIEALQEREEELEEAISNAGEENKEQIAELTKELDEKTREILNKLDEDDRSNYIQYSYARNELVSDLESQKQEFDEKQALERENFEAQLEIELAEKYKADLELIEKKEQQLAEANKKAAENYIVDSFFSSEVSSLIWKQGQKEAQLRYYTNLLPADTSNLTEEAQELYVDLQKNISKIQGEINALKNEIASHDSEGEQILDKAQIQLASNKLAIKGELDFLRKEYDNRRQEFANKTREEFDKKQQADRDSFLSDQADELKDFDRYDDRRLNSNAAKAKKQIEELRKEFDKKMEPFNNEALELKEQYKNELNEVQNNIRTKSIEILQEEQRNLRHKFIDKISADGLSRISLAGIMERYQNSCESKISDYIGKGKQNREEIRQIYYERIQNHTKYSDNEVKEFDERMKRDLMQFDENMSSQLGSTIEELKKENVSHLNNSLGVLDRLYAERTSIPEKIKLLELELKDAEEELARGEEGLDNIEEYGFDDFVKHQESVMKYESKHKGRGIPEDIINYTKQYRISRSIANIIKSDINAWVNKNIKQEDISDKDRLLTEASVKGQMIFEEIDRRSEEEIYLNTYESDFDRNLAKDKAFFKVESELLSTMTVEMKEAYRLYSSLLDLKKAYIDVADFDEQGLREFNDATGISSKETLKSIRSMQSMADPDKNLEPESRLNPLALYNTVDINSGSYSERAQQRIMSWVTGQYMAEEKAATQKEEEEQKKEYDSKIRKLDYWVEEYRSEFNINNNSMPQYVKDRDKIKNELDLLLMKIESEAKILSAIQNQLKDLNTQRAQLNTDLEFLKKLSINDKSAIKTATKKNISTENLPGRIEAETQQLARLDEEIQSVSKTIQKLTISKNENSLSKKDLTSRLAQANDDIKGLEGTIKKKAATLKMARDNRNAVEPFVYKPKKPITQEQREKTISDRIDKIVLSLRDNDVFNAIEKVYINKHQKNVASRGSIVNIAECKEKINRLRNELEELKLSQSTNKKDIINCNNDIAQCTADKAKYEMYGQGLGSEYDDAKRLFEQETNKFDEIQKKQNSNKHEQEKIQEQLREKLKDHNSDPFAKKDLLFKKRRLIQAAVKKTSKDFESERQYLNNLVNQEADAYEKYIKEDQYGVFLEMLSSIDNIDALQNEANKINDSLVLNVKKAESHKDSIKQLESEIKLLGEKEYDDRQARADAIQVLSNKHEQLKLLYSESRVLEEDNKRLSMMEQALNIVKLRMNIRSQEQLVSTKQAYLNQVKATEASVEQGIQELRQDLIKQSKAKLATVSSKEVNVAQAVKDVQSKYSADIDKDNNKIQEHKNNINTYEQEIVLLKKNLSDIQKLKEQYKEDNVKIDQQNQHNREESEKNKQQVKEQVEKIRKDIEQKNQEIQKNQQQIQQKNSRIIDLNSVLELNAQRIKEEEKIMQLNMLAERKAIGKRMLDQDVIKNLSAKKERLENFQIKYLPSMFVQYDKKFQTEVSTVAITKVNVGLREKMSGLIEMSKTVKKWFGSNSTHYTNMINSIKAIERMDVTSDPATVKKLLVDAKNAAQNYIDVRAQDWFKFNTLLRRTRQTLAREIVRSCKLLSTQYEKFELDKAAKDISVNKYKSNQQKVEILKLTQKDNGACTKFCELYTKPIVKRNDGNFKTYRDRDVMFKDYKQNIYTDEWDKIEKDVNEGKLNKKDLVTANLKTKYVDTFIKDRKFALQNRKNVNQKGKDPSVDFIDETEELVEKPMIYKIMNMGLAHVKKVRVDETLQHHQFSEDDPRDYSSINIDNARKKFDDDVKKDIDSIIAAKELSRSIEEQNRKKSNVVVGQPMLGNDNKPKQVGNNKVDINKELQGFGELKNGANQQRDPNSNLRQENPNKDQVLNKGGK